MKIGGHRLLIVEDEPLLRITMADALRKEGWTVDVAEDGVKGAALFEQHLHDTVLSDLVMPKLGGMELLKRIKALQPETTVVIITAHGTVDRAVEAMREGASDFITKPFSMAQVVVRIANVCSVRVLREQNVRLQEQLEQRHSFSSIIGRSTRSSISFGWWPIPTHRCSFTVRAAPARKWWHRRSTSTLDGAQSPTFGSVAPPCPSL